MPRKSIIDSQEVRQFCDILNLTIFGNNESLLSSNPDMLCMIHRNFKRAFSRFERSPYKDGKFRVSYKINGKKVFFVLNNNRFEPEHYVDREMRLSYGQSPDLEKFIAMKHLRKFQHSGLMESLFPKFKRLFGNSVLTECSPCNEVIDRNMLSVGPRVDKIYNTKNNRFTYLELINRKSLRKSYVEKRIEQLANRKTDKFAFVALSWQEAAYNFISEHSKCLLFSLTLLPNDQPSFKFIV